jgi:hypothetical protein
MSNRTHGDSNFIGGGQSNCIATPALSSTTLSVIVGGNVNGVCSSGSFVGGGNGNVVFSGCSAIVGGISNISCGTHSFIGGGCGNTTTGCYSSILGGTLSCAPRFGQRSFSSGSFNGLIKGTSQQIDLVGRNKTTNATPVNIFLDGTTQLISVIAGTAMFVTVNIGGIKSDGSGGAHYIRKVAIKNVGGVTSLIGTVSTIGTDVETNSSYDVAITADDTNDALDIQVTGVVGETLRWTIHIEGIEIVYGT